MQKSDLTQLMTFLEIVDQGSFTRAGAQLGVTVSAVSQSIRSLEARLGVRLVNRTTRTIQLTEVGVQLADELRSAFNQIGHAATAASASGAQVSGTIRLTMSAVAAEIVIQPIMAEFRKAHPGIALDFSINERFVDIVSERFDAGIRRGDVVNTGMVSHRISPDIRMLAVASRAYLDQTKPIQEPRQLKGQNCIQICSIGAGGVPPWRFLDASSTIDIKVTGTVVVDKSTMALDAALKGVGIAYLGSDYLAPYLASGQLISLLDSWAVTRPGFHLYHSGHHLVPEPLTTFIQFLVARANLDGGLPTDSIPG